MRFGAQLRKYLFIFGVFQLINLLLTIPVEDMFGRLLNLANRTLHHPPHSWFDRDYLHLPACFSTFKPYIGIRCAHEETFYQVKYQVIIYDGVDYAISYYIRLQTYFRTLICIQNAHDLYLKNFVVEHQHMRLWLATALAPLLLTLHAKTMSPLSCKHTEYLGPPLRL